MAKAPPLTRRPRTATSGSSDLQRQLNEMLKKAKEEARVTLTNGIVIQTKPISQDAIRRVIGKAEKPKVPIVRIESRDREEENPNDPDYLEALNKYYSDVLQRVYKTMMMLGTECYKVPAEYYKPEDKEWIEYLEAADVPIEFTNQFERYHEWLTLYACTAQYDYNHLTSVLIRRVGIMEQEVIDAITFFQHYSDGGTVVELPDQGDQFGAVTPADDSRNNIGDGRAGLSEILPNSVDGLQTTFA